MQVNGFRLDFIDIFTKLQKCKPDPTSFRAVGRKIEKHDGDICIIREQPVSYNAVFDQENEALRQENGCYWEIFLLKSVR
ncbi:protein of unknown function [Trichlorobacter ammonificans]|uniref:Uncharacterized protein n=1 Tax=Trichlorobacter ammonificans TaxID=2916410 RepID=A0ABN8HH17_9BACT|nr:protein of unknown function [Trichlorobacter ammonificans]